MPEGKPTPITRGVEIQKTKNEGIRDRSINRYKELVGLETELSRKIDEELSKMGSNDNAAKLAVLFEQKHVLDEIGEKLEEIILNAFEREDTLRERWLAITELFAAREQGGDKAPE